MQELLAKVLTGPWRIASTLLAPELPVTDDPARQKWSRLHVESHPTIEILLALEGAAAYGLEERLYRLEPGDWMIFLDGERHDSGYGGFFDDDFCHGWFHLSA
ncbi:MAG: AraC family ligand binding domain-containing protein, partial [Victivallaceae bacterium]